MSILVFLALLALCCGYALLRGGAAERTAAGLQIGAFALTLLLHRMYDAAGFGSPAIGTAAVDVVLLAALVILAWRSTRFWPLWIAAWQATAIIGHAARLLDPTMLPLGYAIQATFWGYPMLVATAVGVWRHRARMVAGDPDPSWKSQMS